MKAVIMAGGEGTRLRPITCTMPKPMVPLLNKPVMDYCIELITAAGIEDVTATLHYLPRVIMEHCGSGERYGVKLSYSLEDTPLGTAGSVRKAVGKCQDTALVMSGDAMTDLDIRLAFKAHRARGAKATIVLKRVEAPMEYGVALTSEDGRIYRFLEKPSLSEVFSDLANTGIYILEPEVVNMIPQGRKYDFSKDLFPLLLARDIPIYGYVTDKYWCDIGDIGQYRAAQQAMLEGRCAFKTAARREGEAWLEEGAMISRSAELAGPCYIGRGAEIGEMATVGEYTVIGSGARLGAGSSARRSILMENSRVRERAELRGSILCPGAEVESGAALFSDTVIGSGGRVGRECTVCNGASVWPGNCLEDGEDCRQHFKWPREHTRPGAGGRMVQYADTHMTPENAARCGAAFGAVLGRLPVEAAVATDGSQQAVMLKHGLISGLLSQGVDAADLGYCGYSAFEHGIREFGYGGGVYIRSGKEPHLVELRFCDRLGAELSGPAARALEQELKAGQRLPVTSDRLGIVQRVSGLARAYEAHLERLAQGPRQQDNGVTIIIGGCAEVYDGVARVLIPRGYRVRCHTGSPAALWSAAAQERAQAAFMAGEELEAIAQDERIGGHRLMAVLALDAARSGRANRLALPADMPEEYLAAVRAAGAEVITAPASREHRLRAALEGKAYLPELHEPEAGIIRTAELVLSGKLREYLRELPEPELRERRVECGWRQMGRLLRGFADAERQEEPELIDGIKVKVDKGWVLVRPDNAFTACRVIAGSMDAEYSEELADIYGEKLRRIADSGE